MMTGKELFFFSLILILLLGSIFLNIEQYQKGYYKVTVYKCPSIDTYLSKISRINYSNCINKTREMQRDLREMKEIINDP